MDLIQLLLVNLHLVDVLLLVNIAHMKIQSTASDKRTTESKDTFNSGNFSSPDIEEITADIKGKLGYSETPSGAFENASPLLEFNY